MCKFAKLILYLSLSAVASCSHYSHQYVENPDEINREQFEVDFRQCEETVENGPSTGPSKGEVKEIAKQHALNLIPLDRNSIAIQAALGIVRITLGGRIEKKQLVRRCLKLKGYEVKWLTPEYDIPIEEDGGASQQALAEEGGRKTKIEKSDLQEEGAEKTEKEQDSKNSEN